MSDTIELVRFRQKQDKTAADWLKDLVLRSSKQLRKINGSNTKIGMVLILSYSFFVTFAGEVLAETTEVVHFKSKTGVSSEQLIGSAKRMEKTMYSWNGFISRELIELGGGEWIDIVHWENLKAAKRAAEIEATSEVCLPFFALIEEAKIKMYRGDVVLRQVMPVKIR